jgi:phenylpropionate dioxygenase-like ring-hydroxylating dioxygenase large terminal subunit
MTSALFSHRFLLLFISFNLVFIRPCLGFVPAFRTQTSLDWSPGAIGTSTRSGLTRLHQSSYSYNPAAQSAAFSPNFLPQIRPLNQNWWPATLVTSLDEDKPNAVQILGHALVLWKCSNNQWACLEDACSHRSEPLSEGSIVRDANGRLCLECRYDGWQFNEYGRCQWIPQTGRAAGTKPVATYPTRVAVGMVWVYTDPASTDVAQSLPLPIATELYDESRQGDDECMIMKDVTYGFDLLGESLLDLQELERGSSVSVSSDPRQPLFVQTLAQEPSGATVAFYEPSHVRYDLLGELQSSSMHFFLTPTAPGKSRVFFRHIASDDSKRPRSRLQAHLQQLAMLDVLSEQRRPTSYKGYTNLVEADGLATAFGTYVEKASQATDDSIMASSVQTVLDQAAPLSRYESHGKHCRVCREALSRKQSVRRVLQVLQTACMGAAGASTLSLLLLFAAGAELALPLGLLRLLVVTTVTTDVAVAAMYKLSSKVKGEMKDLMELDEYKEENHR